MADEQPRPLSVLHVVVPGEVGGKESVVRSLAAGHAERGHTIHVAAVIDDDGADHAFLASLEAAGVQAIPLRVAARAYRQERRELGSLCRRLLPDIVHTHDYRSDVIDAGVARTLRIPTVTTVHGFTGGDWKNRTYEWLQRRSFRRFDAVVAVSRPLAGQLRRSGVEEHRISLVPNAYRAAAGVLGRPDARRRLRVDDGRLLIGYVGRLSHEKGVDILVEALARFRDREIALCIIGDGPERAALQARAASLGLTDRITWTGMIPDASNLFAAFDLFALGSRTEGTPIVLFEAMAAGVPIVATRVGGVPDVITPADALLIPPEDPPALASAIGAVFADAERARGRARAARARLLQEYGVEPWLDKYEALYRNILHSTAR